MDNAVTLLCKYEDHTCFVMIRDSTSFSEVARAICKKWPNLNPETVYITCSLPGHEKCFVDCDVDLLSLVAVVSDSGVRCINADVFCSNFDSGDDFNNDELMNLETDLLASYCHHEEKHLLSDVWAEGIKKVGQKFVGGVIEFRNVLSKYSIQLGFEYKYKKNDSTRVTAVCKYMELKDCKWHVHARTNRSNEFMYIKELYNVHTCGAALRTTKNTRMSSNLVASEIMDIVREKTSTRPIDVLNFFKVKYGQDITYNHAWLGVEKARNELFGDYALSFDQLRWYMGEVNTTNPGSRLVLEYHAHDGRFRRLFVAFYACIKGFNYCRPMIFLDGTHLKGRYKGYLLGATGKDADQGFFPFCFAVVDSEDVENWIWFLERMREVLSRNRVLTFISDRNQGLLQGVKHVFPEAHHSYCLHHLKMNLRAQCGGKDSEFREGLVNMFRECLYAPTVPMFNRKMAAFRSEGGDKVAKFLKGLPFGNWSNAHFQGERYGELCSNVAESFNSWIREIRFLPIVKMVDSIRLKVMDMMAVRRAESLEWKTDICPNMEKKLISLFELGKSWLVRTSTENIYEVLSHPTCSVDLSKRSCSCYQWQLKRFPCVHAVAALKQSKKNLNDFVELYFHSCTFREVYAEAIYPISTVEMPVIDPRDVQILPPLSRRQTGRPKKKRILSRGECIKRQFKCSRCGQFGNHNRTTCGESLIE